METVFSKEIQAGLARAHAKSRARRTRLRVIADGNATPVLRMWKSGFAVEEDTPRLRGLVDLYDGSRHLFQCLIVTASDSTGERLYEFKRATAIADRAALDFEVSDHAPAGLIGHIRL